jgi:hypothetical protein
LNTLFLPLISITLIGLYLTVNEVETELVLEDDVHFAPTRVISLENTLSGIIFPQEEIVKIGALARKYGLKMHLDGARIWHVSAETGVSLSELCAPFDSVSLCFSKGLGGLSASYYDVDADDKPQEHPSDPVLLEARHLSRKPKLFAKVLEVECARLDFWPPPPHMPSRTISPSFRGFILKPNA